VGGGSEEEGGELGGEEDNGVEEDGAGVENGAGVEEGASEQGPGGGTIGTEEGASGNRRKEISSTG
jgi:hypothetical protein